MPADPVAAGKKGGSSRSPKKVAAARRNGFQRVKPAQEIETRRCHDCATLIVPSKPEVK